MRLAVYAILTLLLIKPASVVAQQQTLTFPVQTVTDSSANSFKYILPEKNDLVTALPKIDISYYTLSRSLRLNSLGSVLNIMIGKDRRGINFVVFDSNDDKNLSNDEIIYFSDSTTSPTKGNYKHYRSRITINKKDIPLNFDYSIIKPKALNISFNDSLEDKIHFMVRSNEYKHGEIAHNQSGHPFVVFTSGIYDFSKKSAFLISASQKSGIDSLKLLISKGISKFVPGDIALMDNEKFLFEGLTPLGDSIIFRSIDAVSDVTGTKVGFIAPNFDKTDILSGHPLTLNAMKGKYVLLDFWGTWCAPCMKIMEDIKKLHENFDGKSISMIGVCYDDNVAKVKTFIQKRQIGWNQIFDRRDKSELGKLFEVTAYPSFILIDPQGKIVFRDEGINGFERLSTQLPDLLKK